ncbi:Nuclear pore glycoprotein p62, partial [Tinamus guttatus]
FSFGAQPAATAAPAAFSLGGNAPKLNLGGSSTAPATGITGGFGFGSAPASAPSSQAAAPSGFIFATAGAAAQPAAAFSLGAQSTGGNNLLMCGCFSFKLLLLVPGLNFGSLTSTTATSAPPGTLTTGMSQAPTLSFGAKLGATSTASTTATTTTTSLLGSSGPTLFASIASSSAPTSSTTTSLSLGAPSTSTGTLGTLGFGLKVPGTTAAATSTVTSSSAPSVSFALNLKPLTTTGTIGAVTSTATVTTATTSAPPVMTYAQLESLINKWSLELEDQEKHFLHQATQVNAWDRTLIENGEKITSLHREVEKVKLDQKRLDQELDFILSQQKELEDLLTPLEESVKEQSGTIYLQHADEERERTYKLAENIDAQLKRMAQDLKDIIEHLNTSGGPADTSDPLQQICKILNAHMDSLQWIDQNSALLQRKVEEVTKVCESRRKEQERSFRITFD